MSYKISDEQRRVLDEIQLLGGVHKLIKEAVKHEREIDFWGECFIGSFKDQEIHTIENFKIVWKKNDIENTSAPHYGIAEDLEDIKFLIRDGRIRRKELEIDVESWENLMKLNELVFEPYEDEYDNVIHATDKSTLETIDKIVFYLTGDYYKFCVDPGEATKAYFENAAEHILAMNEFHQKAKIYLLDDIIEIFLEGVIDSWKNVLEFTKSNLGYLDYNYHFVDLMKEMKIIARSSKATEFKIAAMRTQMSKIMITDPRNFFSARDHQGRAFYQNHPEEYSPVMNTLFQCLIYAFSPIPETQWEMMENEFFKRIPEEPSYESWHRNRRYFYKIIDREFREAERLEKSKNEILAKKKPVEESEINYVIGTGNQIKMGSPDVIPSKSNRLFRAHNDNSPEIELERKKSLNESSNSSNQNSLQGNYSDDGQNQFEPVCRHCSHHARKTVHHQSPFKGKENCLYDPRGKCKVRLSFSNSKSNSNKNPCKDYLSELVRTGKAHEFRGEIHLNSQFVAAIKDDWKTVPASKYSVEPKSETLYLSCRFRNPRRPENSLQGQIIFDSGSPYSIIHHDNLKSCQYKIVGKRDRDYFGAGGEKLPLEDYLVDVCIEIADNGTWILKRVMVTKSDVILYRNQLIFGRYDMNRLNVVLDMSKNRVKFDVPVFGRTDVPVCGRAENDWWKLIVEKDVLRQNFVAKIGKLKFELDKCYKYRENNFGNNKNFARNNEYAEIGEKDFRQHNICGISATRLTTEFENLNYFAVN